MTTIVFLGIDLAKNVFALHGVDAAGRACLVRPSIRREQLLETVVKLPPCHRVIPALMEQGQTCVGSARLTLGGARKSNLG